MSSNGNANEIALSPTRTAVGALVAFAISVGVLYLDVRLDPEITRPLFFVTYWVLMLVTSVCTALAVSNIRRLVALGAWRVGIGLATGLLTFVASFFLLVNLQFLFGGHK